MFIVRFTIVVINKPISTTHGFKLCQKCTYAQTLLNYDTIIVTELKQITDLLCP